MVLVANSPALPAHHHVRLDCLARAFQIGAGLLHVETNGVQLVTGGFCQAVAARPTPVRPPATAWQKPPVTSCTPFVSTCRRPAPIWNARARQSSRTW